MRSIALHLRSERVYSLLIERSVADREDLTGRARIRDAAMARFAADGVAATSLRSVARAAGVSPALVVHHFGSKEGLVRAVDEAVVDRIVATLSEVPLDADDLFPRRAEVVSALLRGQPTLCDYIARALSERTEASADLFHRMFAYARRDRRLVEAGALRGDADPFWRAMHQLVLVVGPLMLRPLIERELDGTLLDEANFDRWARARTDLLQHGLYRDAGG
jgi:TetR/AcrR family transcriptional regulator, regulator of cefoperazone and chloramphenicol sensitivity